MLIGVLILFFLTTHRISELYFSRESCTSKVHHERTPWNHRCVDYKLVRPAAALKRTRGCAWVQKSSLCWGQITVFFSQRRGSLVRWWMKDHKKNTAIRVSCSLFGGEEGATDPPLPWTCTTSSTLHPTLYLNTTYTVVQLEGWN